MQLIPHTYIIKKTNFKKNIYKHKISSLIRGKYLNFYL
jgi:hypothetical protein